MTDQSGLPNSTNIQGAINGTLEKNFLNQYLTQPSIHEPPQYDLTHLFIPQNKYFSVLCTLESPLKLTNKPDAWSLLSEILIRLVGFNTWKSTG